ncbi:hypothetical protein J4E93_007329 [Alternaria ventricosa]|uniref:uncharacterized protein n=1 Tax=Alternaria ventricosa TaxID=1187951 RepID=UPI0020C3BFF8|nr:uncharacterized protein J4E93_007329 [Alternaria ventricosa]KAI4642185.1 hypothetical protein J4E93_007329 [Alternaria ventricosa]
MFQRTATPLQQALRSILLADMAMNKAVGPDEWMEAANQWREEIASGKKAEKKLWERKRPLAEDFFYTSYPPEPKPRDARNALQQRKEDVKNLQSEIEKRAELGDIDQGPLPRAQPRHGNSVDRSLRMRLTMKEERLVREKKTEQS